MNDAIADAVTCLLLHSNSCPAPLHHDIKSPAESVAAALAVAYVLDAANQDCISVVLDGGHVHINKHSLLVEVANDCPACFPRGAWSKDFSDENLSPSGKCLACFNSSCHTLTALLQRKLFTIRYPTSIWSMPYSKFCCLLLFAIHLTQCYRLLKGRPECQKC